MLALASILSCTQQPDRKSSPFSAPSLSPSPAIASQPSPIKVDQSPILPTPFSAINKPVQTSTPEPAPQERISSEPEQVQIPSPVPSPLPTASITPTPFPLDSPMPTTALTPVPVPYQGNRNPVPWENLSAQTAGKGIYEQNCSGCHGAKGDMQPSANFTSRDFRSRLEKESDYFFWRISEGKPVATGFNMPAFKGLLTEDQRWQVLTYLWSLGAQAGP